MCHVGVKRSNAIRQISMIVVLRSLSISFQTCKQNMAVTFIEAFIASPMFLRLRA